MSPVGVFSLQPVRYLRRALGNGAGRSEATDLAPARNVAMNSPLVMDFAWGGYKGARGGSGQQGAGALGDGARRVRQARAAPLHARAVGSRT